MDDNGESEPPSKAHNYKSVGKPTPNWNRFKLLGFRQLFLISLSYLSVNLCLGSGCLPNPGRRSFLLRNL